MAGDLGEVTPMLATPGHLPDEPGWAFEFGWDGVRSLADVGPDHMHLFGGRKRTTSSYPELDVLPALAKRRVLLDGKIVALDACGRPSLPQLLHRMNLTRPSARLLRQVPVAYYVFDLLRLDNRCTLQLPYQQRRELLAELDLTGGPIVLTPYFLDTDAQAMLDTATQYSLHGVVAKRVDSTYQPGRRTRCWVQTALRRTQEVVIGGWLPAKRGPAGMLGSLLVGVPTEQGLRYTGQVSTGITDAARTELHARLTELEQRTSPFADEVPPATARTARWVAPQLHGEVSYQRWTSRGRLAHPSWAGIRRRKHPAAVHGPVVLAPVVLAPVALDPVVLDPVVLDAAPPRPTTRTRSGEPESVPAREVARREQLSPHFLYNALAAISVLVRTDPLRARELLMDFAGFTRYCFRSATEFSTLAEELENIDRYLALERARFEERLQVVTRVAPQVFSVVLPFLSVQSVVEHAVRHGIEETPGGGTVAISALVAGADCLITVEAEGLWAPHQGLAEVEDRLRSAFGDGYGLVVDSTEGVGSRVSLRVPMSYGSTAAVR
ncbi:MAG: ATP dependent DNA ligase [Pseudonocardiales bacterium]